MARGFSGAMIHAVSLDPCPVSRALSVSGALCISSAFRSLQVSLFRSLFLCLSCLFASHWVSARGRSGALAGWYLDADDNAPAYGQQVVVHGEDPIEDWKAVGDKGGGR